MKLRKNFIWMLLPALLLVLGSVLAGPPQPVSACNHVIEEPGKYKVVNDLTCPAGDMAIRILASDVMLDLGGHTISCATFERSGVIVGDDADPEVFSNVRISNGTVSGCGVGVLVWFADGVRVTKMSLIDNGESGVTLVEAQNSVIKKNSIEGSYISFGAIFSYAGTGNWIGHNTYQGTFLGIDVYAETDSRFACNTGSDNYFAFGLNPFGLTPSSGNLVRGNQFTSNVFGMGLYGVGEPPDTLLQPIPTDNLIHANIVTGNWLDLTESIYSYAVDDLFLFPDAECNNMWKNNMFESQYGPEDCIGTPVVLDEVCAMEDDD